jgi:hypothetical protein
MKIRKFWEALDYGRTSNRVGYATEVGNLPSPSPGSEWEEDLKFDEKVAVSNEPRLQQVMDAVRNEGSATVLRIV